MGLWTKLVLHLADISNPLRGFSVSKLWAIRIMEEFFEQGDEEKKLGMPAALYNDRDHVDIPSAQLGFVSFLVAPLLLSTVHIFPMMSPLAVQMASNMREWYKVWVQEMKPSSEDSKKKKGRSTEHRRAGEGTNGQD